jgi:hypothetical protein
VRRLAVIRKSAEQQLAASSRAGLNAEKTGRPRSSKNRTGALCGHWMPIARRRCILPVNHRG